MNLYSRLRNPPTSLLCHSSHTHGPEIQAQVSPAPPLRASARLMATNLCGPTSSVCTIYTAAMQLPYRFQVGVADKGVLVCGQALPTVKHLSSYLTKLSLHLRGSEMFAQV